MNRRDLTKALLAGAAGAAVGVSGNSVAAEGKVRLRMQTYWGKESNEVHKAFTDDIKTASGGSLRVKRYPGSSLVPDAEMFQAVSKGTIDMAQGYAGYWPGKLDVASIESGLPGAWTSYDEARYIFDSKGLTALIREAYAEQGVHYFGPIMGGPYDLLTKKPVGSLEELKTMKIRATPSVAKVLQQFDIPTVFMPASELYVGLTTGAIDGVIYGGPQEYKSMKLYEAAKYYTYLNMVSPGFTDQLLINKKKWDSLTDAQRKILEMAYEKHAVNMHNWLITGSIDAASGDLFEFSSLSEEDSAKLRSAAKVIWEEEAKKSPRNQKAIDILTNAAKATGRA